MDTVATLCDSFLTLEVAVKTDLPELRSKSFQASETAGKDENTWELTSSPSRAAELIELARNFAELESTIRNLVEIVRSMALSVAPTLSRGQIMHQICISALAELVIHQQEIMTKPVVQQDTSFDSYHRACFHLLFTRSFSLSIAFLHKYSVPQLATIFARLLVTPDEIPPAFVPDGAVDWATANRVLLRVRHLHSHLQRVAVAAASSTLGKVASTPSSKSTTQESKERFFEGAEMIRLADKVQAVEALLMEHFSDLFTRKVIVKEVPTTQPDPAAPPAVETEQEASADTPAATETSAPPEATPLTMEERLSMFRDPLKLWEAYPDSLIDLLSVESELIQELVGLIDAHTSWRQEDIVEDTRYMEPEQILQAYFRNVVIRMTRPKLVPVRGDGNCFFRAVIKFLWPSVSQFYEDLLSVRLRALINPRKETVNNETPSEDKQAESEDKKQEEKKQEETPKPDEDKMQLDVEASAAPAASDRHVELLSSDPYKGFIIPDVNDPNTMANPGVWADHVQVKKASDFLQRPIWLLRYDDINLVYDSNLKGFIPGQVYKIGADEQKEPITLFFTPETHYEVMMWQPQKYEDALNYFLIDALKDLRNGPTQVVLKSSQDPAASVDPKLVYRSAENMCRLAFALEKSAEHVEEKFAFALSALDASIKIEYRNQIQDEAERAKGCLVALRQLVGALCRDSLFLLALREQGEYPLGLLLEGVLTAISEDEIHTVQGESVTAISAGNGPLSAVFHRLHFCRSNVSATLESMKANKKRQEARLKELLSKQPSRGLLAMVAESNAHDSRERLTSSTVDMENAAEALQLLGDHAQPKPPKPVPTYAAPTFAPFSSSTALSYAGTKSYGSGGSLSYYSTTEPPPKRQKVIDVSDDDAGVPFVSSIINSVQNSAMSFLNKLTGPTGKDVPSIHMGQQPGFGLESRQLATEDEWSLKLGASSPAWELHNCTFHPQSFRALLVAFDISKSKSLKFVKCVIPEKASEELIGANSFKSMGKSVSFSKCQLLFRSQFVSVYPSIRFEDCTFADGPALSTKSFYGR